MEGGNTFTSQFAGEGYTDNLGDEHFRNLARLRLGEEMMTLLGKQRHWRRQSRLCAGYTYRPGGHLGCGRQHCQRYRVYCGRGGH